MKNLDRDWMETDRKLEELIGELKGLQEKNRGSLPDDMNCPESQTEVDAVGNYAQVIYDKLCDALDLSEALMVQDDVQRKLDDRMNEDDFFPAELAVS